MKNTKKTVSEDKVYVLKRKSAPLTYMLSSRNTRRSPLLYFDGETNKPLRYARNQQSPFEDEQDGNAIIEPILFEEGFLRVPRTNPVLQQFLVYHPGNGEIYNEVDNERDASEEFDSMNFELDAQLMARDLTLTKLESIGRVLYGVKAEKMTTPELKRDVLIYSKREPKEFINLVNDPMLELQDKVVKFFSANLLSLRNKNKDVYFNLKQNKTKMLTIPYGENPYYIVASYFQSDQGIESLKLLENKIKK
tara:strand:+ start:13509 stop:14258 length:750 start_codon:yes stop_codon:yes gene_type:complete